MRHPAIAYCGLANMLYIPLLSSRQDGRLCRVADEEAGALSGARAHEHGIAGSGSVCYGHIRTCSHTRTPESACRARVAAWPARGD